MASRNGLTASFAPNPIPGKDGNGFHITLTPRMQTGDCSEYFLAGILEHAAEITAILNPTADSYKRSVRSVRRSSSLGRKRAAGALRIKRKAAAQ